MAIVYVYEVPRGRGASNELKAVAKYDREWTVRTDNNFQSLESIVAACGAFGQTHPENAESFVKSIDVKAADDSGLAYTVRFQYASLDAKDKEPPAEPAPGDDPVAGLFAYWSASSSVTTVPTFTSIGDVVITNSAGDPLVDGCEKEQADPRMTFTSYYPLAATWWNLSKQFTNKTNNAVWNGGDINTWKCQGCSGKWLSPNKTWEVSWDFVYREENWNFKPWDIGFAEYVDAAGAPIESTGSISETDPQGGIVPVGTKKKVITGQDGKQNKTPVALRRGKALPAGEPPDALNIQLYFRENFVIQFGELKNP